MSIHQHAKITETLYFWFASNDTSGSGGDGASPAAYCRLAGAAATAANVYAPVPVLLTDASYPAGCYEMSILTTTGNGFADGSTYAVFCTLAVDSQNPTGFVGSFTLAPIPADLTEIGGVAQSADDLKDFADAGYDPATNKITGVVLADTVTNLTNLPTMPLAWVTGTGIEAAALDGKGDWNTVIPDAQGTAPTVTQITADIDANSADLDTIIAYVDELETRLNAARAGYLDNLSVGAVAQASVATEARLAELDAANLPSDVDAILLDTGTTLDTKLNDIQGATFDTATDSLEEIRNRGDIAWKTGAGGSPPQLLQSTTIATLASQTSFTLTAGSSDDSAYVDAIVVVTDQTTSEQKAVETVSVYTGTSKTVTLSADPAIFTMAVGDTVEIIAALGSSGGGSGLTAQQTRDAMKLAPTAGAPATGSVDEALDNIEGDTNELQTDDVPTEAAHEKRPI